MRSSLVGRPSSSRKSRKPVKYYISSALPRTCLHKLWLNQQVSRSLAASVNYSWQSEPEILDDLDPFLPAELNLPPAHRFNAEVTWNGSHYWGRPR